MPARKKVASAKRGKALPKPRKGRKAGSGAPQRKAAGRRSAPKPRTTRKAVRAVRPLAGNRSVPAPTPAGPSSVARASANVGRARRSLRIALFGATGMVGSRILAEALARGHRVTAIQRDRTRLQPRPGLAVEAGSVTDPPTVRALATGHDAIVSAVAPPSGDTRMLAEAARVLLGAARQAGVKRLVVVGGAGSLEVAPGVQLVDTPAFPEAWKWIGYAHRDALAIYRSEGAGLDWTFVSPPAMIQPGARSGSYQVGADRLLKDKSGQSAISAEDFAVAIMDEVEHGRYKGRRMTVASA